MMLKTLTPTGVRVSAMIYGGRSPIALEICRQLVVNDHEVHLITRVRDKEILDLAKENGCTEVHECDLTDLDRSVALANEINNRTGGLDAVAFMHRYRSQHPDAFNQFAVEVNTPHAILEMFSKQSRTKECSIIFATSPAAEVIVQDQNFQYHASKAAISQLVRFGAVKFSINQIRVNGINPGTFVFKDRSKSFYNQNPQIIEQINDLVPLGRMAVVEEIANVATFLLSKTSSYINGEIINIDGGLSKVNHKL
jgi:NAD(P)-dependent dehydrogenase (short-subunit alcohol dehydrogenase family)